MLHVDKSDKDSERYVISSIEKAIDVLELIAEKETVNLIELAETMNKPKSSLYRIISTLEHKGYVTRSEDNEKYCLGLKPLLLTKNLLQNNSLRNFSLSEMKALSDEYGDSVNLGIFTGEEVLYIAVIEGSYPLRFTDTVGSTAPFHATGIGKAIIANLPKKDIDKILEKKKELAQITPHTITEKKAFYKELEKIKSNGYALDDGEVVEGARCIAVPVFDMFGNVIAAISLSGAVHRYADKDIISIALKVQAAAKNISQKLGHSS